MVTLLEKNQVKWFETPYGQDSMCSFCGSSVHWEDCEAIRDLEEVWDAVHIPRKENQGVE